MAKKTDPFVKGLIDKYREAALKDRHLTEAFESAKTALHSNRETMQLCAGLLRKVGVDPAAIEIGIDPAVVQAAKAAHEAENATNGNAPLNITHAVYLIIKKRGNTGFSVPDLLRYSAEDGTPLTPRDLHKVLWTQLKKGRMERLEDGRIRLTEKGEAFNDFRRKASDETQDTLLTASTALN